MEPAGELTRKLKQEVYAAARALPSRAPICRTASLVMPVEGRDETGESFATVMISRDHGGTWTVGNPAFRGGNECQAAQLGDGSIMLNMRNDHERLGRVRDEGLGKDLAAPRKQSQHVDRAELQWQPAARGLRAGRPNMRSMSVSDWNTNDPWQRSRVNFEGWRFVRFPLPGNYPGEGYHWPYSSQWRHTSDGVVKYPLTFKRLILEMPEKMLYLTSLATPARREIYLKDLLVTYRPAEEAFSAE